MADSTADSVSELPDATSQRRRPAGVQNKPRNALAPRAETQAPASRMVAIASAATTAPAVQTLSTRRSEAAAATPSSNQAAASPVADHYGYVSIDRAFRSNLARLTFGLSPAVLWEQTFDWFVHLATSPGKQMQIIEDAFRKLARLGVHILG